VKAVPDLGQRVADANDEVIWHDPFGHGYTLVTLTSDDVTAAFKKVSTVYGPDYTSETAAAFKASYSKGGVTELARV
jgi:alkaline phosphatase D